MDNGNHHVMDDTTMMRYLLGKYGLTDLVAMLRSAAASGEPSPAPSYDDPRGSASGVPLCKSYNSDFFFRVLLQSLVLQYHPQPRAAAAISPPWPTSRRTRARFPSPMPAQ